MAEIATEGMVKPDKMIDRISSRKAPVVSPQLVYDHIQRGMLTDRDTALIGLLASCNVLTSNQILRMFWPHSVDTKSAGCRRRLAMLRERGYVNLAANVRSTQERLQMGLGPVYTLGKGGEILLTSYMGQHCKANYPLANTAQLGHDVGLSEVLVCFTEAARERNQQRPHGDGAIRLNWRGEAECRILIGSGRDTKVLLEPDALSTVTIETGESQRRVPLFIEWDMNTERFSEWQRKVKAYDKAALRQDATWTEFGDEGLNKFPAVAVITTGTKGLRVQSIIRHITESRHLSSEVVWLVTDYQSFREDPWTSWNVVTTKGQVLENQSILPA